MHNKNLPYWLAALHLDIPPIHLFTWLKSFDNIATLFQSSKAQLQQANIPQNHIIAIQTLNWQAIEKDLQWSEQPNHHLISFEDELYPPLLKELANSPYLLYVRGNKTVLTNPQIAIVGSRRATPAGIKNAERFAQLLANAGLTITSGLAIGIDAASHRGALAASGITIGVMGTGLDHIYPKANQPLASQILQKNGAIVSEFPLTTPAYPANFPRRNRIIAGLSLGTLVVESALKSGSLITAKLAADAGREVFAIPGSIQNPVAQGCHYLIQQGAKLVTEVQDILEEFPVFQRNTIGAPTSSISESVSKVLSFIEYEVTPMDVILLRSRLNASELSAILLTLEVKGYIQSVPGGYIREDKICSKS